MHQTLRQACLHKGIPLPAGRSIDARQRPCRIFPREVARGGDASSMKIWDSPSLQVDPSMHAKDLDGYFTREVARGGDASSMKIWDSPSLQVDPSMHAKDLDGYFTPEVARGGDASSNRCTLNWPWQWSGRKVSPTSDGQRLFLKRWFFWLRRVLFKKLGDSNSTQLKTAKWIIS